MMSKSSTEKPDPSGIVCSYCNFVQDLMGSEQLDPVDEKAYVKHLKRFHGLEK
jgi:hypothetical protein